MSTPEMNNDGLPEVVDLWRRTLEAEIELDEAFDVSDYLDDPVDEDELAAVQETVFRRLGIERSPEEAATTSIVASFLADLENWRLGSTDLALARDVGSLLQTIAVAVPELRDGDSAGLVEVECDLDEFGRVCDVVVLLIEPSVRRPSAVTVIGPDGARHTATFSSFGVAKFSGLSIDLTADSVLRFELHA